MTRIPPAIARQMAETGQDEQTATRSIRSLKLAQQAEARERRNACRQAVANWFGQSVDNLCRQHDEIQSGIASISARMDATDARIAAVLADYRSVA